MLLHNFDGEIEDMKGFKSPVAIYLFRIVIDDAYEIPFLNVCPGEQLFRAQLKLWFAYIINYLQ